MSFELVLSDLLDDHALLLAVGEQVSRSMNGASARRLANVLDDLAIAPSLLGDDDRAWLADAIGTVDRIGRLAFWRDEVDRLGDLGARIVTCADAEYPANLSMVHDRPPVLFVQGDIRDVDARALAVVGSRKASYEGVRLATEIATALSETGVTVVSGLARGIDSAAHAAAVNAGGRTIAVFGTAIDRVYPAANKALARSVARSGACVSQFLTTTKTGPWAFPVRNVTTSGLSIGTIVVEAGETSGARLQAEAAIAHGKRVILVERLVTHESWAQAMAPLPGVTVAGTTAEIVEAAAADMLAFDAVL